MLWLAGLMGLMAVGAVNFIEMDPDETEANGAKDSDVALNEVDFIEPQLKPDANANPGMQVKVPVDDDAESVLGKAESERSWNHADIDDAGVEDGPKQGWASNDFANESDTKDDMFSGSDMEDTLAFDGWIAEGQTAQIMDYESFDDSVVLIWDDTDPGKAEPEVTLSDDPENDAVTLILMDGIAVASVNSGDMLVDDIVVVPLSTAEAGGFMAA